MICCAPVDSQFKRLDQENREFEAMLDYMRLSQK